jgi:dolichol-phosphate mannosyltransferase
MEPLLSVVLPVYNEGPGIERVLRRLEAAVNVPHETLVVHDFDEDTTVAPTVSLARELPQIRTVRNDLGPGALNALRTGIQASHGRYVLVTMADGCDEIELAEEMARLADAGAVVVAASRYMRGGRQEGGPRVKAAISRAAGLTLHWIGRLPIHDPTNNFKLYERRFLQSLTIESGGGFELALEVTVKAYAAGLPMAEVPTTWHGRVEGESRFRLRQWLPHYLRWYLKGMGVPIRRLLAAR